jgi:hypothetical protein
MNHKSFTLLMLLTPLTCLCDARAQWTGDSTLNTVVADGIGSQATPIIRPAADGGVWISFWDSSSGAGLRPVIQRLDVDGNRIFAGNGIELSARTNTASYTTDMRSDGAGNAYVVFDDNAGGSQVTRAHKVRPDGSLAWGAQGVAIPGSSTSLTCRIAPCADGTVVVLYQQNSTTLGFQRINADGSLPAGGAWTVTETSRAHVPSDLLAAPVGGDVIALWVRAEGTSLITSRKGLRIQRFNSANQGIWNSGTFIDVYQSASVSGVVRSLGIAYYPTMVSDGAGGAVISWYDGGTARNAWLQHVSSDGTQRFAPNGLQMSSVSGTIEYRLAVAASYDITSGAYVVAFERSNTNQSQFGLNVQRVSSEGVVEWGANGIELYPVVTGSNHKNFINIAPAPGDTTLLTWFDFQGANSPVWVKARRMDAGGQNIWSDELIVSNTSSAKGRLGMSATSLSDMFVVAFSDSINGTDDIKAQNINLDGSLGPVNRCQADFNGDGGVDSDDVIVFFGAWDSSDPAADFTRDGGVDSDDVIAFFSAWDAGC